ncbi:MAG: type II toxin-antitoxin system Phd/YefM family antitoxin [Rickettsiales bacterium]|nr:MAG: type II toxin-antitoxin system Phd/YefM family antitoxin [Rickettsiales bacterium]
MPEIRKSADLRNNYGEVSQFCHRYKEPIFITKNGVGDLAVMSIDAYNELSGRIDLYKKLIDGIKQINNGETVSEKDMMKKLDKYIGK